MSEIRTTVTCPASAVVAGQYVANEATKSYSRVVAIYDHWEPKATGKGHTLTRIFIFKSGRLEVSHTDMMTVLIRS